MGFRDLHLFNLAMLARQGWRLLLDPDSLCAQVLKAKYYPDGNLLSAIEKPGISYSWRSIVRGFQTIKSGMIWRVGDGSRINIWNDPWLPRGVTRQPITPRGQSILTSVVDLIDPMTGVWDRELVEDIFWEEYVKVILAIPVKQGREDAIAWHYDPKGLFSVKSAYHVLEDNREQQHQRQQGTSSSTGHTSDGFQWLHLWNFRCLPKIKQFLWRLAHNSLPWRLNIKRRGVKNVDTKCPVCQRLDEDGGHCFLKCKIVQRGWRALNLEHVRRAFLLLHSAQELVHYILKMDAKERTIVSSFMWVWWENRNKANAKERMMSMEEIIHKTKDSALGAAHCQTTIWSGSPKQIANNMAATTD
jgi:hypothetical protein